MFIRYCSEPTLRLINLSWQGTLIEAFVQAVNIYAGQTLWLILIIKEKEKLPFKIQ
jgi:hypothetical protein